MVQRGLTASQQFQEYVRGLAEDVMDVERALVNQTGDSMVTFAGMDKSAAEICHKHRKGECRRKELCPYRHVTGKQTTVCKHWLRGLCKKSDMCEFLHEYDMSKMPECQFYSKTGECNNEECMFRHIDPESKIRNCVWFDKGFCKHGNLCKNRHKKRAACQNYINGFCPEGPNCPFSHPKWERDPMKEIREARERRLQYQQMMKERLGIVDQPTATGDNGPAASTS
eukprot:Clim_evm71s146 gene=Clim_evmTU71s146